MEEKMNRVEKDLSNAWNYFKNMMMPTLVYGVMIGAVVGAFIFGYGWIAEHLTEYSVEMYSWIRENLAFLPLLLLGLALVGFLLSLFLKKIPDIQGGGIPYTEGVIRGRFGFQWPKMVIGTIISSFVTYFVGLPLGSEGPSVQIGACLGEAVNEGGKKLKMSSGSWKRLSITGGAAAGLATAFNAPLTGICFALEEAHQRFSPMILLTSSASALSAVLTRRLLMLAFNVKAGFVFYVSSMEMVPLSQIWILVILGLFIGAVASLYTKMAISCKSFFDAHKKISIQMRVIALFLVVGTISVFVTDLVGGGTGLIKGILNMDFTWQMLLLLLFLKLVFITLSSTSGVTGGIFIPMLALGALAGGLLGRGFIQFGWMDEVYYHAIVVMSMCAFLGAVTRSPLTSIVLVVEITGQVFNGFAGTNLDGFLGAGIVIVLSYFVMELTAVPPLYDYQLEGIEHRKNEGKKHYFHVFEVQVEPGSFVVGKMIKDVLWPAGTIVLKVETVDKDGNIHENTGHGGDGKICAWDKYTIQAHTTDLDFVKREIDELVCKPRRQ